ncbi:MAG TPA: hypothetical protein GX008_01245 [Firmicutes bacterium]|nr:MAG: hypothetical protein AA931_06580 [Peptococcaceae bacterium 1109]HHT72323.1 hypothetical protein [Bacillota bacterium]
MPKDKRNEGKKARRTQKQQMGAMPNAGNLYETGEELGRQQQYQKQQDGQQMQSQKRPKPEKQS